MKYSQYIKIYHSESISILRSEGFNIYVALRTPTKGSPLGTYNWNMREPQKVKGLRSKLLVPKES